MIKLNKKLFGEVEVSFPVDDELAILIGLNGSGKSLTLQLLKEYWEDQGEEVLYFPDERFFTKEACDSLWYLVENDLLDKYKLQKDMMKPKEMEGRFIHAGYYQLLNFFGTIMSHFEKYNKEVIVIIDEPERNLHISHQSKLLSDIFSLNNVKKLVVATHSPEIISNHFENVLEIEGCLE